MSFITVLFYDLDYNTSSSDQTKTRMNNYGYNYSQCWVAQIVKLYINCFR